MVNQNEPSDQHNSNLFRLRNSAIGPWIDSSFNSIESTSPIDRSHSLNNDIGNGNGGNDLDDEDIMIQVGNLSLVDDFDTSSTMYRAGSDMNDAIIEQSHIDQTDSYQYLDDHGIEVALEPQDVSIFDFDENESSEDLIGAITVHDYNRVLQLSNPLEFSIPSADFEDESNQSTNMDNFITNFEMSLSRIEDIQREIDDIRQLYNNLLEQEELPPDTILEYPNTVADHENTQRETDTDWGNEIVSVETIENQQDQETPRENFSHLDGRISRLDNMDSFSDFFHHLPTVNDDGFNFELEFENDLEEESIEGSDSIVSSSWQFDHGQLVRRSFPEQRRIHSNQRNNSLLPNFYLDSNGIPRIDFEKQFNLRTRHILSNDPSSKSAPFCRIDSNGDLECVFAFYSPSSMGELKVSVQDKHEKEVETLLFKEIKNSWRNDHGECIGR